MGKIPGSVQRTPSVAQSTHKLALLSNVLCMAKLGLTGEAVQPLEEELPISFDPPLHANYILVITPFPFVSGRCLSSQEASTQPPGKRLTEVNPLLLVSYVISLRALTKIFCLMSFTIS